MESRPELARKANARISIVIISCDHTTFRSTKHWTRHRSPPLLLDLDTVTLVEVSSVSGVARSRRAPFRLPSRLWRRRAVVDSTSTVCALDRGARGRDGLLELRVCGRVRRCRRITGGPSPSLSSVSTASAVLVLREECARSHVEPSERVVWADMSTADLEVSSCSTKGLSSTVRVALFRSLPAFSGGCCMRSPSSSGDLSLSAMSISGAPESFGVCTGRFSPSGSVVRGGKIGLSVAGAEIDPSPRKASHKARLAPSSQRTVLGSDANVSDIMLDVQLARIRCPCGHAFHLHIPHIQRFLSFGTTLVRNSAARVVKRAA